MGIWSAYLYIYTKYGTQYKAENIPKNSPSCNHLRIRETVTFSYPVVDVLAQVGRGARAGAMRKRGPYSAVDQSGQPRNRGKKATFLLSFGVTKARLHSMQSVEQPATRLGGK